MASPPSDPIPLSPISDDSFDFVTAAGSSSGGASVLSLGSDDVVFSPHAVSVPLSVTSGGDHDGAVHSTSDVDSEDGDLVLVGRGRAISESAPLPDSATSVLQWAAPDAFIALLASTVEAAEQDVHTSLPVVLEESSAANPHPNPTPPPPAPADVSSVEAIDRSAFEVQTPPSINGMPAILVTSEYPNKAKVLDKLYRVYPKRLRKLEVKIADARSSPSLIITTGKKKMKSISLDQLLTRKSKLEQQIQAFIDLSISQIPSNTSHLHVHAPPPSSVPRAIPVAVEQSTPVLHDALSSAPVPSVPVTDAVEQSMPAVEEIDSTSYINGIPAVLVTAEYPTKSKVLDMLYAKYPRQIQKVEKRIAKARSSPTLSVGKKKVVTLNQLLAKKAALETQIQRYTDAAVLRVGATVPSSDPSIHSPVLPTMPGPSHVAAGELPRTAAAVNVSVSPASHAATSVVSPPFSVAFAPPVATPAVLGIPTMKPAVPNDLVIPDLMTTADYPHKTRVLLGLKRIVADLVDVEGSIALTHSLASADPVQLNPQEEVDRRHKLIKLLEEKKILERKARRIISTTMLTILDMSPYTLSVPDGLITSSLVKLEQMAASVRDLDGLIAKEVPSSSSTLPALLQTKRQFVEEIDSFISSMPRTMLRRSMRIHNLAASNAASSVSPPETTSGPAAIDELPTNITESSSDGVVRPATLEHTLVPDILRTADYPKKANTILRLDQAALRMRELETQILAYSVPSRFSHSISSQDAPPSPKLKRLLMQKKACQERMNGIISAALLRVNKVAAEHSAAQQSTPALSVHASEPVMLAVPPPSARANTEENVQTKIAEPFEVALDGDRAISDSEDGDLALPGHDHGISHPRPIPSHDSAAPAPSLQPSSSIAEAYSDLLTLSAEVPAAATSTDSIRPAVVDDISQPATPPLVASRSVPALETPQLIHDPHIEKISAESLSALLVVPERLRSANYSKKSKTLRKLDRYMVRLRELNESMSSEGRVNAADSVMSGWRVAPGRKRAVLEMQFSDTVADALRRVDAAEQKGKGKIISCPTVPVPHPSPHAHPGGAPEQAMDGDSGEISAALPVFPAFTPAAPEENSPVTGPVVDVNAAPPSVLTPAPSSATVTIPPEAGVEAPSESSPVIFVIPRILYTTEYPRKDEVLGDLRGRYPELLRSLETQITAARTSFSLTTVIMNGKKRKTVVSLDSLLTKRNELLEEIQAYTDKAVLEVNAASHSSLPHSSPPVPHSMPGAFPTVSIVSHPETVITSTARTPAVDVAKGQEKAAPLKSAGSLATPSSSSPYLTIPETLRQSEYKRKKPTLQKLEAHVSQLRLVLEKIVAAESARVPSPSSAPSQSLAMIGKLRKEKSTIEKEMQGIIRAALKRADSALVLAKRRKLEAKRARKAAVKLAAFGVQPSITASTLSKKQLKKTAKTKEEEEEEVKASVQVASSSSSSLVPLPTLPSPPPVSLKVLDEEAEEIYAHAVEYMTSHLAAPTVDQTKDERKATCQALLAETGVALSLDALPTTLTSARNMLREHVHINVRDYAETRAQGLAALRAAMHPSVAALQRDVRKRPMSITTVKEMGLRDLLVQAFGPN